MKRFMPRLLAAWIFATAMLALPAMAQESTGTDEASGDATQEMQEILNQPKPTEDGAKQAPQGEAPPEENWFGCQPDPQKQGQHCSDKSDDSQESDGSQESGETS